MLSAEGKKQVDEEMKEFDFSDKTLLLKLIEVYERRLSAKGSKETLGVPEDKELACGRVSLKQNKRSSLSLANVLENSAANQDDTSTKEDRESIGIARKMKKNNSGKSTQKPPKIKGARKESRPETGKVNLNNTMQLDRKREF